MRRFWDKVKITSLYGCWEWTAGRNAKGYGYFWVRGRGRTAPSYRAVYEMFHGQIPDGADIHHTCKNRACVHPLHLEALTRKEHKVIHRKTHCSRGHARTPENLTKGGTCKICNRAGCRKYREEHLDELAAYDRKYYQEHMKKTKIE